MADQSGADETDSAARSVIPKPIRSVTPGSKTHHDEGMDVFGWGMLAGLLVLLVPLLPFILIVWGISKILDSLAP